MGETHFRCGQSPLAPVRGNNFGKRKSKSNIKYNLVWRFKFMSISQPFQHTSHQFIGNENHISTVYEAHFHQRCREQKISRFSSILSGFDRTLIPVRHFSQYLLKEADKIFF